MTKHTTDKGFIDLEIRIFPSDARDADYPVEITLDGQQEFRGHLSADVFPWMPGSDPVEDGRELFEVLFEDKVLRQAWAEARGRSAQRRIRLRIDASAPELHALPWELLHEDDTMLAANADTPFSRYLAVPEPWSGAVEERPIRVLAVVSNPGDLEERYNLASLDVDVEQGILQDAFQALDKNEIEMDFLDPPVTLKRIAKMLQNGYHILHYVGHGAFDERKGHALYLQDEEGDAAIVHSATFVNVLARQSTQALPRLVFLAACQSAARSTASAFLGFGPNLVTVGVPAVVAMQDNVNIGTARELSLTFYQRLVEHGMVDCALNQARSVLLAAGRPDAAVPVLFMRLESGQLWEAEAETSQAAAGPRTPSPPEPTPPPEVSRFVGRETELATFTQKLVETNLAVITGMPGVGKTAFATVLARYVSAPHKIFWHECHQDQSIEEIVWKLAGFLYRHDQRDMWEMLEHARLSRTELPSTRNLMDYLIQLLRHTGYTICLDNVQLLPKGDAAHLVYLVQQLRVQGIAFILVTQIVLAAMARTKIEPLTGLKREEIRNLLVEHGLSLPQELHARLYARTEGNPQLLILSIHILQRADNPAKMLNRLAEAEDIERYLMKKVDEGLTEKEREIMVGVAILQGHPGTRDAIETITGSRRIKRTLLHLGDQHLLRVHAGKERKEYTEHTMVRDFYYDVPGRHEQREMHQRAAGFYEREEPPDIPKAVQHYTHARDYTRAAELSTRDIWAIINQGQTRLLRHLLEQFEKQQLNPELWARVNIARGTIYTSQGKSPLAQESYREALSGLDRLPDSPTVRDLEARACRGMGDLLRYESTPEALDWLRRGLDALAGANRQLEADLHIKVSTVQAYMGKYAAALDSVHKGLELLPEGPSHSRAGALGNLGMIYRAQGDIQRVGEVTLHALEISRQMRDFFKTITILNNLGNYKLDAGDWNGAINAYLEGLALAKRLGIMHYQIPLTLNLGIIHLLQGNYEPAAQHFSSSLQLARQSNRRMYEIGSQANLADLYLRQGDPKAAAAALVEAERLALETKTNDRLPEIYRFWAQVRLAEGDPQAALEDAERSANLARELKMDLEQGMSLRVLGQALRTNGQHKAALDAFENSLSFLAGQDPYETARTRHQWGLALIEEGNVQQGTTLLQEARATFANLGAKRDLAATDESL